MKKLTQDIIEYSDLLLDNIVSFIDKFDMEQCEEKYRIKNWEKTPNKDPEWVYMLNRMNFIHRLIVSYELTSDIKYLDKYFEYIDDWNNNIYKYILKENIFHNNIGFKLKLKRKLICTYKKLFRIPIINTIRTLDTSIRCFYIINDLLYLKKLNIIDKEKEQEIIEKTICQLNFLNQNHQERHDNDNWGLIQSIYSLYCLIVIDELDTELYKLNDKKYNNLLEKQILEDGSQIENTPFYHIQIFIAFSHLLYIKKIKNIEISNFEMMKYIKMADYIYETSDPLNNIVNFGDSDVINISELMYIAYLVLDDKKYLSKINIELDINFLSRFIQKVDFKFKNNLISKKEKKSLVFENAKTVILKDENYYLQVFNNDNITSHRHIDLESFVYYIDNNPIFIDSGRYTYVYNKYRKYLKSQYSHNTLFIDNKCFAKTIDSWKIKNYVDNATINLARENIVVTSLKSKNVIYKRFFIVLDEGLVIINKVDNSISKKNNKVNRNYVLNPNVKILKNENQLSINKNQIYIYTNAEDQEINPSIYSNCYNKIQKNNKIILANKFKKYSISFDLFLNKKCNVSFEDDKCILNKKIIYLENDNVKII